MVVKNMFLCINFTMFHVDLLEFFRGYLDLIPCYTTFDKKAICRGASQKWQRASAGKFMQINWRKGEGSPPHFLKSLALSVASPLP